MTVVHCFGHVRPSFIKMWDHECVLSDVEKSHALYALYGLPSPVTVPLEQRT